MKPTCSIVIRAYNEEKHIGRLLAGILQQTVRDSQIILVDSGSTDATVAIAQRFPVKIVHIRPEDFTFGRSLNLGIAEAEADLVVMASAHVYPVYPDWLEKLLAPFSDSQVALAYGKQRGGETTQFSEHQIFKHWYPDRSTFRQEHPFCNNANSAIRRSLWEEHPYSESIPALEDLAWARWAFEKGWAISYAAEAEVIHLHQETWKSVFNRYRREGMAFKQIYPQENFRIGDLLGAFNSNALNDLRAARQQGVLSRQWSNVLHFRWNQFWGTYQGYRQGGALTWQLKQTFYYPRESAQSAEPSPREVKPIQYREPGQKNEKR
jgi:glycosyltransferase involved in cell wall biosynthesis